MKIIKNLIWVLLLLLITGCTEDKFMKDYPQLEDKQHIYNEVEIDKVLEVFENKETALVLMGFPECPWCQAVIPYVNKIAKEDADVNEIYYLNILEMREASSPDHEKYLELKELITDAVDKEKDRINGPTLIVVKEGNLVGYHLDTVSSHVKVDGVLPPMTTEQIAELEEILRNLIKKMH